MTSTSPPRNTEVALKALLIEISAALTVRLALAGPELPAELVRSPVVLFSVPAACASTSTCRLQLALAGAVPPL